MEVLALPSNKKWLRLCLTGLTVLLSASLVACGEKGDEKVEAEVETEVEKEIEEAKAEPETLFEEKSVEIDYSQPPEEILTNYTEKGMNLFKANFPDTLSMNYALKNIGKEAPEIKGKTSDGKEVKLSELEGRNVLISFNKTTCSICQEMSPIIKEITKDNKDVVFLNVFPVDTNKDIKAYYKKLKQDVPANTLSLEKNKHLRKLAVEKYQIDQVPTYVFVDKTGKISYTYIGNKDKVMFQDMINTAFGEEKLYDHVRTITIRVDEEGNEIKEMELIHDNEINEDSVDHTDADVSEAKKRDKKDDPKKSEDKKSDKKADNKESKQVESKEDK